MDDRDFFDQIADSWDDNEVLSKPLKVREILKKIGINPGDQVLDLGTGTGVLLPYIAERIGQEGKITAVDYSSGMLARAKKKFSNLMPKPEFLNLDIEQDTIEGEFDKILLYCVYPHLHEPIDTLKWLKRVNLKPDGEIYIAFPCGPDFINNIHKEKHSKSDLLPPAAELAQRLIKDGLMATVVDEEYIIKIC